MHKSAEIARALIAEALRDGWVRNGSEMICPKCAAYWKASNDGIQGLERSDSPAGMDGSPNV